MKFENSRRIYEEGIKYIPGGVNSPVRAFKSVDMVPTMIKKAEGARLMDEDGNEYIDYIGSWGPMVLGHNDPRLLKTIEESIANGISYGLPTKVEIDMAKLIIEAYPAVDMVRMVNSGTEATMSAIRVARGFTGRKKIVKFEGCYHGHSDSLLVKSGSGTITFGIPTSLGVPEEIVANTLVARYNDIENIREIFKKSGDEIACIIVEPVAGNMGLVPGSQEFLEELRRITKEYGSLLIFDEVISGFRVAYGGAAETYGIEPDMACFGKIIGGGFPVGAYAGKREIMEMVSPVGGVYQAGTLSGNPLAMHTGIRNLEILRDSKNIYDGLENKAKYLEEGFNKNIKEIGIDACVTRYKSILTLFFRKDSPSNFEEVNESDTILYSKYFRKMLEQGIMFGPSQFECIFLSEAHTKEDLDRTIEANLIALGEISKEI